MLEQNHPGAVPALHDAAFQTALRDGYQRALQRIAEVSSFEGYLATLNEFAHGFRDQHIWSRNLYPSPDLRWAGLAVANRGSRWVVTDADHSEKTLVGAELLGCDGKAAEQLARERLGGFRIDWEIPAQRIRQALWLLIDDGNPFISTFHQCDFRTTAGVNHWTLLWRDAPRAAVLPHLLTATGVGHPGYGVRFFEGGSWISLQGLQDEAPKVIEDVREHLNQIHDSAIVVVDVRGNLGGNSEYGNQLAELLLGQNYVESIDAGQSGKECSNIWRATPDNLKTLNDYRSKSDSIGAAYSRDLDDQIAAVKEALAKGRSFSALISCKTGHRPRSLRPSWPAKFKLVLLTDSACFSSCLVLTNQFRHLGAIHMGQSTDSETNYVEVREVRLPSGLSMFATLQGVDLSEPPRVGPYQPQFVYDGDIADTAKVERWVIATIKH